MDQIQREQEAYESLTALLTQARHCKELHERAGLVLPARLQWFLGEGSPSVNGTANPNKKKDRLYVQAPEYPSVPEQAAANCISIDAHESIVTTLILAILRSTAAPVHVRTLVDGVVEYLPESSSGSVANAGTRLAADGAISREDGMWSLLRQERAPILHDGRLWGPVHVFANPEIAAHRREAILHILKHFPSGLQIVQVVEQLKACPWMMAPASKDLLKADVHILGTIKKKIRLTGHSRKWQLAE